jgi:hypothetical protein
MSAEPLQGKTVRSAMQLGLFSCPPGTAHLLVLSPDSGFPVGMISSLDIARAVVA